MGRGSLLHSPASVVRGGGGELPVGRLGGGAMALRARALYDFRSENPEEISLREHEVLSLCSEQDIEGWLEGINSHGDRGLFPASYVQVIRAAETPLPARYTNLPAGGLEPLLHPAAFKPAILETPPAAAPEPFSLPPRPRRRVPFPAYALRRLLPDQQPGQR